MQQATMLMQFTKKQGNNVTTGSFLKFILFVTFCFQDYTILMTFKFLVQVASKESRNKIFIYVQRKNENTLVQTFNLKITYNVPVIQTIQKNDNMNAFYQSFISVMFSIQSLYFATFVCALSGGSTTPHPSVPKDVIPDITIMLSSFGHASGPPESPQNI